MKDRIPGIAFFVGGFILLGSLVYIFADNAVNHADTSPELRSESIGAYYDEIWNATRIFRTQETAAGSGRVRYAVIDDPSDFDTNQDPTVVKNDGLGNYSTLPQHTIITEWNVSGHVHFPN